MIEVATEASLQPLLQFYLFLPALITAIKDIGLFSTLRVADITSTRSIQVRKRRHPTYGRLIACTLIKIALWMTFSRKCIIIII